MKTYPLLSRLSAWTSPLRLASCVAGGAIASLLFAPGCCLQYRSDLKTGLHEERHCGPGSLKVCGGIPVVHVYGTPEQMGTQYGTLLKEPLHALVNYIEWFLPAIKRRWMIEQAMLAEPSLPEDLRLEFKAMAKAADLPYDWVVAINLTPKMHCSTLAAWGPASANGNLIMGRNSDYFGAGLTDRLGIAVVYHPEHGHAVASFNFLGMMGAFTGMNDQGVCFGNMLVFNAKDDKQNPQGMTIQLLMRQAAEASGDTEAFLDFLQNAKHSIPMNVMAADTRQAAVIELSPSAPAVIRRAQKGESWVASSNHFRDASLAECPVNCHRYAALAAAGEAGQQGATLMTPQVMEQSLYAARIRLLNLQAVVFEPAAHRAYVSINKEPASAGPYVVFDMDKLFAGREDPVIVPPAPSQNLRKEPFQLEH